MHPLYSLDHDAALSSLAATPDLLLIQDLDGVCMPLARDPLTRTLARHYIEAALSTGPWRKYDDWLRLKTLYVAKRFLDDESIARDALPTLAHAIRVRPRREWTDAFGLPPIGAAERSLRPAERRRAIVYRTAEASAGSVHGEPRRSRCVRVGRD